MLFLHLSGEAGFVSSGLIKKSPNPELQSVMPSSPSCSAPLGSLLLATVLISHKHDADATGENTAAAAAAAACHHPESFHLLNLGLNISVNKRDLALEDLHQ